MTKWGPETTNDLFGLCAFQFEFKMLLWVARNPQSDSFQVEVFHIHGKIFNSSGAPKNFDGGTGVVCYAN